MLYSMHGCIRCFVFPPHLTVVKWETHCDALPTNTKHIQIITCSWLHHYLFTKKDRQYASSRSIASSHLSLTFVALCVLLLWVCYDVCHWELFIGTGVSQWTTLLGWIVTSTNVNYCLWISIFYFLAWKQVNCCSATFTTSFLLIYDAQQLKPASHVAAFPVCCFTK